MKEAAPEIRFWGCFSFLLLAFGISCAPRAERNVPASPPNRLARPAPAPSPLFEDATPASGVSYRGKIAGPRPCNILQTIGTGVAFLDYDNDGNLDLLFIDDSPKLYRGDGKGRFSSVPLDVPKERYLGVAVGDFDNDGWDDVYLSAFGGGRLLRNVHGRFVDVTANSGIGRQPWGSSATFADYDGDGRLDLFVGNYLTFGPKVLPQLCDSHGIMASCGPTSYLPEHAAAYRNDGGGRFVEVTHKLGLDRAPGKTLGLAAAPWGARGLALAIADDQVPSSLFVFDNGVASDTAEAAGTAVAADGRPYAGMGVDWGDYDNDGQLDLAVATFSSHAKLVFHRDGETFEPQDVARIGLMSSVPYVSFGLKWLDFDNDGWLDLMLASGHVFDNADVAVGGFPGDDPHFAQPLILYRSERGKRFDDASSGLVRGAERPIVGRGLASGDYDNDGRLDAVAVDIEGAPILLHNITAKPGHWLRVKLFGTRSNRNGYGALLTLTLPGGRKLVRHCQADGSYESASDARVWFGLGDATSGDLTVRWPSEAVQNVGKVRADRTIPVREPVAPRPLRLPRVSLP